MKKKIIAVCIVLALMATLTAAGTGWTETQDKVHEIAEIARGIGLPEDDPIIERASEIWWEEQESKSATDKNVDDEDVQPVEKVEEEEADAPLLVYYGTCRITGYCNDGHTASGTRPTVGRTCATGVVSRGGLPFGTVVYIEGIGYRTVEDRGMGGAMWFDVYMPDVASCYSITGYADCWVVQG